MSGSPTRVVAEAAGLRSHADGVLTPARIDVYDQLIRGWSGEAATAYGERRRHLLAVFDNYRPTLTGAAQVLETYASELAVILAEMEAARARIRAISRNLASLFDPQAWRELYDAHRDLQAANTRRQHLAARTADNIYALVDHEKDPIPGDVWPPPGWPVEWAWETSPLPADLLDTASLDPADVDQGGVGDCYLLSSLMTLMGTAEGQALLRQNIRYDADLQGYWVTLYVDGEPTPFFVDRAIAGGVREAGGTPGIATLYEAAMREYLTFADLHDGGVASQVYPLITGRDSHEMKSAADGWNYPALRRELDESGYMVASSLNDRDPLMPATVEVRRPTPYGTYWTDSVTVVGSHAYAVVAVTDEGVWVMNPHGPGNPADQGGKFLLSREDFDRLFWRVSMGEV